MFKDGIKITDALSASASYAAACPSSACPSSSGYSFWSPSFWTPTTDSVPVHRGVAVPAERQARRRLIVRRARRRGARIAFAFGRTRRRRREPTIDTRIVDVAFTDTAFGMPTLRQQRGTRVDQHVTTFFGATEQQVQNTPTAIRDQRQAALQLGAAIDAVLAPLIDIARRRRRTTLEVFAGTVST